MKKRWWIGALVLVLAAGAGGAWFGGLVPGALAKVGKKDEKKPPALEFTAQEVAQPQLARLSARLEFSGPLVAPSTAVVRAKAAGTLLNLNVNEGARAARHRPRSGCRCS